MTITYTVDRWRLTIHTVPLSLVASFKYIRSPRKLELQSKEKSSAPRLRNLYRNAHWQHQP